MSHPSDQELAELLTLIELCKRAEARITEIKDSCKAYGSFCTEQYVCSVWVQQRVGLVGLEEVKAALGENIKLLQDANLIRTSEFLMVRISKIVEKVV